LFRLVAVVLVVALAGCTPARNSNPTISEETRARLAKALEASGDSAAAAAVLRGHEKPQAAAPVPDDPLMHARQLVAAGQVDQGMAEAQAALASRGDDPPFALDVGRLAVRSGRLDQAGDIYQQILLRHPENVDALNGKGVVLAQQGKLADAANVLRQVLSMRPKDVPARYNLALVMLLSGETKVASSILEALDRSDPSPQVKATLNLTRDRAHGGVAVEPIAVRPPV
jgi:Flp pilus assembly protein TadD